MVSHRLLPHPAPRSRLQISQPNFPTYQIRRHESTVDLSTLLFGSPSASSVPAPHPPPPTFAAPEMDGVIQQQQQNGGMGGFFSGLRNATRRLLCTLSLGHAGDITFLFGRLTPLVSSPPGTSSLRVCIVPSHVQDTHPRVQRAPIPDSANRAPHGRATDATTQHARARSAVRAHASFARALAAPA